MKDIFEYTDYREFLRDFYADRKQSAEKFSLRRFASMAGFHSAGFLQMILDGKRNISQDSIRKLALGLKLRKDEAHYFTNLVLLSQAASIDDKRFYAEQLLRSRGYQELHPLKAAQFDYYTRWYCIVIRELVAFRGFQEDPRWIASAVVPAITVAEARTGLDTLLELKLVERDPGGRLKQSSLAISTGDEVGSVSVADFHRVMLKRAAESLDRFPADERDISALTFGAGPETARQVKELVQGFRKQLAAIITTSSEDATDVYELGFQLFPLSRTARSKMGAGGKKE